MIRIARPRLPAPAHWREGAALLVAGGVSATGFQPLMLWPLALAGLALLIQRLGASATARGACLRGWLFGWGHFTIGNGWIATAFTFQAQMPPWLGHVAVVLLAAYLAIYPALAALGAHLLARRGGLPLVPALAACWVLSEWMRGWAFTGFPWNPLAALALGPFDRPGLARVAAWTGTYALSGLVVLLAGYWLLALDWWRGGRRLGALGLAVVPVAAFLLPLHGDSRPGRLPFTLVQPDTRQDAINDARLFERQFRTTAALSVPLRPGQRRLVLWPEGGVPDYLRPGYESYWYRETTYGADPALARERLGRTAGPGGLLLTGATDLEYRHGDVTGAWNVITALDSAGVIRGSYAKAHLVPYGEYLPMRAWLEPVGLSRLVQGTLDFRAGPGPRTIDFGPVERGGWGRAGFQICYEIVFSGHVVDPRHRPDYIFNPSNDGWFGAWGPPQHLAQARLRAIEEGLPVLRATTTGISAVIDAGGGVRAFVPPHHAGRIDGLVPPPLPSTLFARTGNTLALWLCAALLCLALVVSRARPR